MITLEQIKSMASELSPLSPTAPKLARVVADPNSSADDIVEVLRYDQVLTLDILRFANSAASASTRAIATVKDAVIRTGGTRILELVVARHIKTMVQVPLALYGYSEEDLWRHSVAAALAAENLALFTNKTPSGLSFTAALLHDIGKLLIERIASANKDDLFSTRSAEQQTIPFEERERLIYGCSHADIGAEIAATWKLPQEIVEAIRHHHSLTCTNESITDAVKISNIIARVIGEGIGNEGMSIAVDAGLAQRAGISHEQFEIVCAKTGQRFAAVLAMFES
jgi:putative nucleotidyltransferase with HDIG domain